LAARIGERRDAWRQFVRSHGFDACLVHLAAIPADGPVAPEDVERAQRSCQGRGK
jgi:hypothetical protein